MTWRFSALVNKCLYPIVAVISLLGVVDSAQAAAYIKFDGVDGESQDKDHKKWSDLLSFSQGAHPGKGRGGALVLDDVELEMVIDSATDALFESIMRGEVISGFEVELCEGRPSTDCDADARREQHCYLKYEFKNVLVSSYQTSAGDGPGRGSMTMTIDFKDFIQMYTPSDPGCPTR